MTLLPRAAKRLADHSSLETPRPVKPVGRAVLAPVGDISRIMIIWITLRSNCSIAQYAWDLKRFEMYNEMF